jgi:stage IV sporulation protein FB
LRWSIGIGRILGVPLRVHATFPLLFLLVGGGIWLVAGARPAGFALLNLLLLFVCVFLHELGHSVTAVRLGYPVRDITLLPIGGVSRMEGIPEDPAEELLITAAGPLVSFGIALMLAGLMLAGVAEPRMLDATAPHYVSNLCWLNVLVGLFNLLPAFPMDGGRILRALLALLLPRLAATRIASWVGQLMAALMVAAGILFLNPWLPIIGVFVWLGARAEGRFVEMDDRLSRVAAGAAAVRRFVMVGESDRLEEIAETANGGFQQDFPVVGADGRLAGMLDRRALQRGLRRSGGAGTAGDAARTAVLGNGEEPLSAVYRRMLASGAEAALLVDGDGRPAGLVTVEQVQKVLVATRRARRAPGPQAAAEEEAVPGKTLPGGPTPRDGGLEGA